MQTIAAAWIEPLSVHLRARCADIPSERLNELIIKVTHEIAKARSSQLLRSGKPADEQAVIARSAVFFKQHPGYEIF